MLSYTIKLLAATNIKGYPPKEIFIGCCYWNVDSVISDKSHDEVFTEDESFENVGRGIQYFQIPIIYWIAQALDIRAKRMNNKSWICQICNKYFYG